MTKGLSQVLALIVAASVLMMTALILIFMVQGGLDFGDVDRQACISQASAQCSANLGGSIPTPSDCTTEEDEIPGGLSGQLELDGNIESVGGQTIECEQPG